MSAIAGRLAKVRVAAGTATQSTDEAATLAAGGLTLTINASTKRHWDRNASSMPKVYSSTSTGTVLSSTLYTVDHAIGQINFVAAQSTTKSYVLDVDYFATSYLTQARSWGLDVETDMLDTTAFSTAASAVQWRTFKAGLSQASVQLDRFAVDSTAQTFFDRMTSTQDLVIELRPRATGLKFEGFARVAMDGFSQEVSALGSESVRLQVDGELYATT